MTDAPGNPPGSAHHEQRGPVAWMARHRVAANLVMLFLIAGGLVVAPRITQEVFPEVTLDRVIIEIAYPGASPEDVEEGIILAVEDKVRGIDGVKSVQAVARENQARIVAELLSSADPQQTLGEIESAVDRITSFPEEAEEPIILLASNRREVISLIVHGNVSLQVLDETAEKIRRILVREPDITQVEITGLPPPEISVEIPQASLRKYGLSLTEVANRLRRRSIELGAGGVDSPGGEVLLRTTERRRIGGAYEKATLVRGASGADRTVGDLGRVIDGYRETDREAYYGGDRAVRIDVFRVADQGPIEVSKAVREVAEDLRDELPEGVSLSMWNDSSDIYRDRRNLLLENAALGALLVIAILGVFLRPRVAFWVTLGIPIAFLGAFWLLPILGVTINMISMFAFLLALGIVVDDAIVVGEAAYWHRGKGLGVMEAALAGVREVKTPITFAVLTTCVAFVPLLIVPGVTGKLIDNIPLIVIPVLLFSLLECFFVLPAHLGHERRRRKDDDRQSWLVGKLTRLQKRVSSAIERFVDRRLQYWVRGALQWRYATLAGALILLLGAVGVVSGGHLKFRFLPKIEGDLVIARVEMPFGTPVAATRRVADILETEARNTAAALTEEDPLVRGIYSDIGMLGAIGGGPGGDPTTSGGHLAEVALLMTPAESRDVRASTFVRQWRRRVGDIAGVDTLTFQYNIGPPAGRAVAIELSHDDEDKLEAAAENLASALRRYAGVVDIDSGVERGKEQIDLELKHQARALGLDETDLAQQVRAAFFGAEIERQQRGRNELRVYARLPAEERATLATLENYRIRTPEGGEIPLSQAAEMSRGRSYTSIQREEGRRILEVTADVEETVTSAGEVMTALESEVLPELMERYPELTWERSGEQEEQAESLAALRIGMLVALLAMFVLIAVALDSYVLPILVLLAVPFGLVGAVTGHLLMGFDISIMSVFGIIALSGVVVNDSLVLMSVIKTELEDGAEPMEAAVAASARRFRPIILTSLTTFFGLTPIIFETSVQARFLIPMALSLGFGVLFVTFIALFIVPSAYMVVEDVRGLIRRLLPER